MKCILNGADALSYCRLLLQLDVADCPNLSPTNESKFIHDADFWWSAHTSAPAFCASIKRQFHHRIVTDGFSASVMVVNNRPRDEPSTKRSKKRKQTDTAAGSTWVRGMSSAALRTALEAGSSFVGLDPGRRSLFTAVVHSADAHHSLTTQHGPAAPRYTKRSWTKGRWYEESGIHHHTLKSRQWLERDSVTKDLLEKTPSGKTANRQTFGEHARYRMQHYNLISIHFFKPRERKERRRRKTKQQSALARLCNDICSNR